MAYAADRYSWGARFPEQPLLLGTDLLLDLPVQVEARPVHQHLDQLRREHAACTGLAHPNILQDYQLLEDTDRVLLLSQSFPGQKLADVLTADPLSPARCLEIFLPVALAVHYADSYSRVHRLIAPQTIWLHDEQVKLRGFGWEFVDFSIPHTCESTSRWSEPLSYFAPEQVRGERVNNRSDQFSLGVLLYRLLSGFLPFPAQGVTEVVQQILHDTPDWECIPLAFQSTVRRCLQKEAEQRFPSMQALLAELGVEPDCSPQRAGSLISASLERFRANQPEEALDALWQALKADPYCPLVHGHLGMRLAALGRLDQALIHYLRSIELRPYEYTFRSVLGDHEFRLKNFERAAHLFRAALALKTDPGLLVSPLKNPSRTGTQPLPKD